MAPKIESRLGGQHGGGEMMRSSRIPVQVLEELGQLVNLFGVANDAFDHGSVEEAAQLRERATLGIRALIAKHPTLLDLAPRLPQMLDGGLLTYTWPTVLKAIENAILAASTQ